MFSEMLPASGGSGIQFNVKLDAPRKWDDWNREVVGFAVRENVLGHVIRPANSTDENWYIPTRPNPINERAEQRRIQSIQDDKSYQMERDNYNRRLTIYDREIVRFERKERALAELMLAMKRSSGTMHQDTLNEFTHASEVYAYLKQVYAPTQHLRIHDAIRQVEHLEKADYHNQKGGIEGWVTAWKDIHKKLQDMRMIMDADRLRQRFQKASACINAATATFLLPLSLRDEDNLVHMVHEALNFYRLNPPPTKGQIQRGFASLQGKKQDGTPKTYKCLDGADHDFANCPYLNPDKRPSGWSGDQQVWKKFADAITNPKDKRGGAIKGSLQRMGKTWDLVKPKDGQPPDVTFMGYQNRKDEPFIDHWVVDPGSQRHICNRATRIKNLRRASGSFLMAGGSALQIVGYCEALVRMVCANGLTQNVWLSNTAFIPTSSVNLVSTGMLRTHGMFLNERRACLEDRSGTPVYRVFAVQGLWVAETMDVPMEMDWVHMQQWQEPPSEYSFSSFERRPTEGNRQLWHRRLGHAGMNAIQHVEDAVQGATLKEEVDPKTFCPRCTISKSRTQTSRRPRSLREEAPLLSKPFAVLHSDLICPNIPAFDQSTVYEHDFCEITKMHGGKGLKSKADWPGALINRILLLERQYNVSVLRVMTDVDPILNSVRFIMWLASTGRLHERSVPGAHNMNGPAEVSGRMITWMGRTLKVDSGLPPELWPLMYDTSIYIINRLPTKSLDWKTPLGKLYELCGYPNVKPYIDHLRVYGCLCYVYDRHVPAGDKMRPRALQGWLVGYTASNIWRVWIPEIQRIVESRDVLFDENKVYGQYHTHSHYINPPIDPDEYFDQIDQQLPEFTDDKGAEPEPSIGPNLVPTSTLEQRQKTQDMPMEDYQNPESQPEPEKQEPTAQDAQHNDNQHNHPEASVVPPTIYPIQIDTTSGDVLGEQVANRRMNQPTRQQDIYQREASPDRSISVPRRRKHTTDADIIMTNAPIDLPPATGKRGWDEINFHHDVLHAWFHAERMASRSFHQSQVPSPPENWQQAQDHPFSHEWLKAAQEELNSLEQKNTWDIVEVPQDIFIVPTKWVFSYKFDDNGYVVRYKARLCVRGDLQHRYGDIGNTRALTLATRTFRFMMALAAAFDLDIDQMDVTNAFLHALVDPAEQIFVGCPPGFGQPGKCFHLRRALYGMTDSPVRWQHYLHECLSRLGFRRISGDACLYTNGRIIVLYYVDDLALFARREDRQELNRIKRHLYGQMDLKDCGNMEWFLGIRVIRDRSQRKLWLSQDAYIDRIVMRFGLQNRSRVSIPLSSIPPANTGVPASKSFQLSYLQRVGSLMHPAVVTRPDIASAASTFASFSANPSQEHLSDLERSIVYLRDHKFLAILFDGHIRDPNEVDLLFKCFSDASFADDTTTRRSTEGFLFKLFGGPIDWVSRKQQTVTTSTTEAELLSLQHAAKELQGWRHLFSDLELDLEQPEAELQCDNLQTVRLVALDHPIVKTNIRHIHISDLWVRQEHHRGNINVTWVETSRMAADGLTKPLPKSKFEQFIKQLGMEDVSSMIG